VLIFSTTLPVTEVVFTHSGKKLVFTISNNLFLLDPEQGQFRQLTNFLAEKIKNPDQPGQQKEPLNEQDQWLSRDQDRLFPKISGSAGGSRRGSRTGQRAQSHNRPGGPEPVYTDGYKVDALQLTPDERFVTFIKTWPAEGSKPTLIPAYVTRSGYTETISARSKVGEPSGKMVLGILNLESRPDTRHF
jgi:hypothetical protein